MTRPLPRRGSLGSRLRLKLLARRAELRLRRLESRVLTAATEIQRPRR